MISRACKAYGIPVELNYMLGRPPKAERYRKIHVTVEPEVYAFLQRLGNKSEFMNKAALLLMRAYLQVGSTSAKGEGRALRKAV